MMDVITGISTVWNSLKATKELLSEVKDWKVEESVHNRIQSKLTEFDQLQDTIFQIREKLFELQDEKQSLKDEVERLKDWRKRIENYTLATMPGGAIVYQHLSEPTHYICPSCVNKEELHPLQDRCNLTGHFFCPNCKTSFPIKQRKEFNQSREPYNWA